MEEANGKWTLSYEHVETVRGSRVYEDSGICNISAIVGENGSGKSTILNEIHPFDYKDKKKNAKKIFVFKNGDTFEPNNLVVYHNFEHKIFLNMLHENRDRCIKNVGVNSQKNPNQIFDDLGIVFMTNGLTAPATNWSVSGGQLHYGKFSATKIFELGTRMLKKACMVEMSSIYDANEPMRRCYDDIVKAKTNENFQDILDVFYYQKLKQGKGDLSSTKITLPKEIEISVSLPQMTDKVYLERKSIGKAVLDDYSSLLAQFDVDDKIGYGKFYVNILFELVEYMDVPYSSFNQWNISTLEFEISKLNGKYKKYYQTAMAEVEEFSTLPRKVKEDELGHRRICFLLPKKQEEKWKICDFIIRCTQKKNSFFLKNLKIIKNSVSSGERALLNFMSWLYIMPQLDELGNIGVKRLSKNHKNFDHLLLLIDEIDLYLHPEGQRKLIFDLITVLNEAFEDKKVQIILTTHSPFVLSDIPVENCIFLEPKGKDGERIFAIAKTANVSVQTFAANLHLTVRSKFFMSSTMGDFAEKTIAKIINELESELNKEEMKNEVWYLTKEGLIQTIGEDLYRNELWKRYRRIPHVKKRNETLEFSENLKKTKNYLDSLDEISRTRFLTEIGKKTGAN